MNLISINIQLEEFEKLNNDVRIRLQSHNNITYEAIIMGNIDTYNSEHARKQLELCMQADDLKNIVCNLESVNYVSSTGVGLFTTILKQCQEKKIKIYLMGMQPKISNVFELLGFNQFFDIIDTVGEINKKVETKSIFPIVLKCPGCGSGLKVSRPGRFRCNNCKKGISVNENAKIELIQGDIGV